MWDRGLAAGPSVWVIYLSTPSAFSWHTATTHRDIVLQLPLSLDRQVGLSLWGPKSQGSGQTLGAYFISALMPAEASQQYEGRAYSKVLSLSQSDGCLRLGFIITAEIAGSSFVGVLLQEGYLASFWC